MSLKVINMNLKMGAKKELQKSLKLFRKKKANRDFGRQ
jgi:hypothetical protein